MKLFGFFFNSVLLGPATANFEKTNMTNAINWSIDRLANRLSKVEKQLYGSAIDGSTTKPYEKGEVVFRGEPEIGLVGVSSVFNPEKPTFPKKYGPVDWIFDNDFFTQ